MIVISFTSQVVKTGGTPKVPDCFQRTPKKLCIPEKAEILAVNVDSKGESFLWVCFCEPHILMVDFFEFCQYPTFLLSQNEMVDTDVQHLNHQVKTPENTKPGFTKS